MTVPVRYYCPRCETVVAVPRDASIADQSVTPYPLVGWEYAGSAEDFEAADGLRLVCGASPGVEWDGEGCEEPFYLSFVRYEAGERVSPDPPREPVTLADARRPPTPDWPNDPG